MKKEAWLYKLLKPFLKLYIKLYLPQVKGKENIIVDSNYILAGNHTKYLDAFLLGDNIKGCISFIAKDSLVKGFKRHFFLRLGIIPVDRIKKKENNLKPAIEALNNGKILAIFPEGTINRGEGLILPFRFGAVKLASETKKPIIPFAIVNEYKLFKKSVVIIFDKPYYLKSTDLEKENKILMDKVTSLIVKEKGERK